MTVFNELLDWIEYQRKNDVFGGSAYYYMFTGFVCQLQSKYACESLEKAGY